MGICKFYKNISDQHSGDLQQFSKTDPEEFLQILFDGNPHIDNINIYVRFTVKRNTFPKTWFFRKSNCTDTFGQSPTMHYYFGARQIFKLNGLKANCPSV